MNSNQCCTNVNHHLIRADHLGKEELLSQVITILVLVMPKRQDHLRRCQDASGGGFMPQGSSQSQLVSITIIGTNIFINITNIFVFIITITLSFRLLDTFSYVFAFAKFWHFCFICFALFCFCLILLIITMWREKWSKSGQIQDAVSFHD